MTLKPKWLRVVQRDCVKAGKRVEEDHPDSIDVNDRDWADEQVKKLDTVEIGYYDLELIDENRDVIDHTIEIK